MTTMTLDELARRRNEPVSDLLNRDQTLALITANSKPMTKESFRTLDKQLHPGFFNLSGKVASGGKVYYPRKWVMLYKQVRDGEITPQQAKDRDCLWGPQSLPDEPKAVDVVLKAYDAVAMARLIAVWKQRINYIRFQDLMNPEVRGSKIEEERYLGYYNLVSNMRAIPNPRTAVETEPFSSRIERTLAKIFAASQTFKDADPTHPATKLMFFDAVRSNVDMWARWSTLGDVRDAPTSSPPRLP